MTVSTVMRLWAAMLAMVMGVLIVATPTAAYAEVATSIRFSTPGPLEVGFGDAWLMTLTVEATYDQGPTEKVGSSGGTVDVYFSGIEGPYATGLPVQPDGAVYLSQPAEQPLIAAGTYNATAVFNPTPGGLFASSQTEVPLIFTVSAVEVAPQVEVAYDLAVSTSPVITAVLAGAYVDAVGGTPAGTWHFVVTDAQDESVFDATFAQEHGAVEPLRVEIDSALKKGATYTVVSEFTPVAQLAGGLTVADVTDVEFETASGTLAEAVVAPVPMPEWLALILLLLVLGACAAAIVFGVKFTRRASKGVVASTAG